VQPAYQQNNVASVEVISPRNIVFFAILLLMAGCSPPDQQLLTNCKKSAAAKSAGFKLTPADVGELTEACMSSHGFSLQKSGRTCSHDLRSEINRRCYIPDTRIGHLVAAFTDL
jgi:hypothetical protein